MWVEPIGSVTSSARKKDLKLLKALAAVAAAGVPPDLSMVGPVGTSPAASALCANAAGSSLPPAVSAVAATSSPLTLWQVPNAFWNNFSKKIPICGGQCSPSSECSICSLNVWVGAPGEFFFCLVFYFFYSPLRDASRPIATRWTDPPDHATFSSATEQRPSKP